MKLTLSGILHSVFGAPDREPAAPQVEAATEYKGYSIRPAPRRQDSGWLTAGVIQKQFPEGMREHRFVRADTYTDRNDAVAFCVTKAKQIIDEQGDRMFGSTPSPT